METESKLKVVEMPVGDIIPYENNARLNDDAVEAVADSIRNYGFQQPIVVDKDNVIICGHTRRLAAMRLGLKTAPVVVARELSPEKVRAYRLDDNKTAELSQWDFAKLQKELEGLQEAGYDMDSLAFDQKELEGLLAGEDDADTAGETDADDAPEAQEGEGVEYDSARGCVYQLGRHRLVCGDACEALDLSRLLEGDAAKPLLWLTDPPYNCNVLRRVENKETHEHKFVKNTGILNDNMSDDAFDAFIAKAFGNIAPRLAAGAVFYIFHSFKIISLLKRHLLANDFNISCQLIWLKNHFTISWGNWQMIHEHLWYGWKNGAKHKWLGEWSAAYSSVLQFPRPMKSKEHPTMKPVEMLKFLVRASSEKNDVVLDTFGGSGSTLIACEQTGRVCRMMELDPKYCDVIRKRWAEFVHGKDCDWKSLTPKIGEVVNQDTDKTAEEG